MFLAIDPSSTAVGIALFESGACTKVQILKPRRQKDPALDRIDFMVGQLSKGLDYIAKLRRSKRDQLVVIVEVTSGKVNRNRHSGGGAGLAVYGDAVGSVRTMCRLHPGVDRVVQVFENDWIGGFGKAKRRRIAKANWKTYSAATDRGADLADAIALGVWWKEIGRKRNG